MSGRRGSSFAELEIYRRYEELSELLWNVADKWTVRAHLNIGDQMLRAVDSIGANIAEAVGRGHHKESLHHLFYARGSLTEAQHWIRVAVRRKLIDERAIHELRQVSMVLHKQLNSFIRSQSPRRKEFFSVKVVSEAPPEYGGSKRLTRPRPKPRAKSQEPRAKSQEAPHV